MKNDIPHELLKAVESVVREEFTDAVIDSVLVDEDVDSDGEPILRVTVVFQHKASIDAKKAAGLVRHIRPKLNNRMADWFPIVSFRSKADHMRLSAAA